MADGAHSPKNQLNDEWSRTAVELSSEEEWSMTVEEQSSDEGWSTAPASPSGVPPSPCRHVSTVNNEDPVQCSPPCYDGPRQDPHTTSAHAGQQVNVDTSSLQHPATSDLEPTSTTHPNRAPSTTTEREFPDFDEFYEDFEQTRPYYDILGRFNKRAYRQGHQTIEFFQQQPTPNQESSDEMSTSTTTAAGFNRHRAVVKGTVQGCPGAEKCADCKAGRSAPVQVDGSDALPANVDPSPSKTVEESLHSTTLRLSDMYYGLLHTEKDSVEAATESKSLIKSEFQGTTMRWGEIFCSITDRLRQKAAQDTILHLVEKIEKDKIEKGAIADYLPFLADDQIFQMIDKAKSSSERLYAAKKTADGPSKENKSLNDSLARDERDNAHRARAWGKLLLRENRKTRARWIAETEVELQDRQSQGTSASLSTESLWRLLQAVKDEDPAATRFDEDVLTTMLFSVRTAVPDDPNMPYEKRYEELIAAPGFFTLAKTMLKEWCVRSGVRGFDRETGRLYQNLVRAGDGLPKDAWSSALPPVWDSVGKCWRWKDSSNSVITSSSNDTAEASKDVSTTQAGGNDTAEASKDAPTTQVGGNDTAEAGKDASTTKAGSNDTAEASKDVSTTQAGGNDTAEASKDVSTAQAGSNEEVEEKAVALTKNQKRAMARKEKRKAKREAGETAGNLGPTPEIPDENEDESKQAVQATNPETPVRTEEEFQQAVQATSAGVKEALESEAGPSTSTQTVTKDGQTYRVPAPARVDLSTAVRLATRGQLRIHMCPALNKGDAAHILKASHLFQSGIDSKKVGHDPFTVTKFLMKVGMKPTEYEQVLELNKFLEVMKKLEQAQLNAEQDVAAVAETGKTTGKGKGKAQAASIRPDYTFDPNAAPVPYPPPPPRPWYKHTITPWATSLTPPQIASLSAADSLTALRALLVHARSFLSSAARSLTADMFDRLVDPAAGVLGAMDLPPAQYRLARHIVVAKIMQHMHAKYVREKKTAKRGTPVMDYVGHAGADLAERFEMVEKIVELARALAGQVEEEIVVAAGGGVEKMKLAEVKERAEEMVEGSEELGRRAEEKAEGMVGFLDRWPRLEALVLGQVQVYVPA